MSHPSLSRYFVLGACVLLLTLASFGLGVNVGTHTAPAPVIQPARAESASLPAASNRVDSPGDGTATAPLDTGLFREAWDLLQKQYYGSLPQGKDVTYSAIRGLVDALGDPHTAFVDPKRAAIMSSDIEGQFEGIGARVQLADGGGVLISYLFPQQPAEKAGIQVGDVIIAVDGKDVTHLSLDDAISLVRGPKGSTAQLTLRRPDKLELIQMDVVRARIDVPVVTTKVLADGRIAYIGLSEFTGNSADQVAAALRDAVKGKPAGLILDLRGNPGGYLDAAVRIGSFFVPAGRVPGDNIVLERFKDGTGRDYQRQGDYLLGSTPLVVLVDNGSASASEIVAGAVQDAGTGVLIGDKTYGKGSVQLVNSLSDASQLRVTVAHWFTPKNRGIDGTGLAPDLLVPLTKEDIAAKNDPQLDRAVGYLQGDHSLPATPTPAATPGK